MSNDIAVTWKHTLGELSLQLAPDVFDLNLSRTQALSLIDNVLTIGVPNQYAKDWLELRLARVIASAVHHRFGPDVDVSYVVLQANGQALLDIADDQSPALVRAGDLREHGFVTAWHDLRLLYGPMIGLIGVGLWVELRGSVNGSSHRRMIGHAWPGIRLLEASYTEGRTAITSALDRLRAADLVDWCTARDMVELYERSKARGVPDAENPGVSAATLNRLLCDPTNSRIYSVNDPLDLPAFCVRFSRGLELIDNRVLFTNGYAGRISRRWQEWVSRLMAAHDTTVLIPDDFLRLGLV